MARKYGHYCKVCGAASFWNLSSAARFLIWKDDYGVTDDIVDTDILLGDEKSDERKIFDEYSGPKVKDVSSWEVSVRYQNGETQEMHGYGDLPLCINELTLDLFMLLENEDEQ